MVHKGLAVIEFASQRDWEEWLERNHEESSGLWLKIAKRGSGAQTVTYPQATESALCYGWIDGQKDALDERYWLQRFTARKPASRWSKINRKKAETLIRQGRMREAGLAQVRSAQADGRWQRAYDGPSSSRVPEDLERALEENVAAREFFATLDSANRYAILYRVAEAKLPATRERRIEKFIGMLAAGEKIHP